MHCIHLTQVNIPAAQSTSICFKYHIWEGFPSRFNWSLFSLFLSSIFVRLSHTSLIYAREAGNINSNRFVPSRGRAESSLTLLLLCIALIELVRMESRLRLVNALEINLRREREREKGKREEERESRSTICSITRTTRMDLPDVLDDSQVQRV